MRKELGVMGDVLDSINDSLDNATGSTAADRPGVSEAVQTVVMAVIAVVGIVAVVMIILGGIQYSTSQGASDRVKKAKDTIMYGIIGLVVALLAFAIVNFVLGVAAQP